MRRPPRPRTGAHTPKLTSLLAAAILTLTASGAAGVCGSWDVVPTPDVGDEVTRLTSVTALAADDAWAVGFWRDESSLTGSLATRWDGTSWELVALPSTSDLGTEPQIQSVDHAPNGDVWIAGYLTTSFPTNFRPLVMRWRNGSWDEVDTVTLRPQTVPPYEPRGGFAYEVAVIAEDDAWAVGEANGFGDASATTVGMALHWDGSQWTDVDVPIVANYRHELTDVVAIASDDVWAVGQYRSVQDVFTAVTYHWDGSEWSYVENAIEAIGGNSLADIAAIGPDNVWALGRAGGQARLMHWNGSSWSLVEAPPHSVGDTIAVVAPDDIWVSGWNGFWHWDGATWTEIPGEVPGATYVIRGGAMEVLDACDIWSVGFWTLADGSTSFTLAERLQADITSVPDQSVAGNLLELFFPNPYRPGDTIRFSAPQGAAGSAQLTVYDIRGRAVRDVELDASSPSSVEWTWDGRGDGGKRVPAGVYLVRLEHGDLVTSRKLMLR